MLGHDVLLLIHILLLVYWLGGDLGVFYSSRFVVNPELSREARLIAAKIMLGCDLVPRICMSLMLTVGGLLSATIGVDHTPSHLLAIIALGPIWLSMVLVLHYRHHDAYIPALTKIDFYFRWLLIVAIMASCFQAVSSGVLNSMPWLIAKLLGFAFLIFCGLMIRIKIKDFSNTYLKIINDTQTEQDNRVMMTSLASVRPWVVTIWLVLILETYLGIAKPV